MTNTQIANLALRHLGATKLIADLDSEDSKEARAVRSFYDLALDEMLRAAKWGFATTHVDLSLVDEDPTDEWAYSYAYPSNCLMIHRIMSGARNDSRETRVPFQVIYSANQTLIYTDMEDASVEYTYRVSETARFTPEFTSAFAMLIAAYIAPNMTAGDPAKFGERALGLYQLAFARAAAMSRNEEQPDIEPGGSLLNARA